MSKAVIIIAIIIVLIIIVIAGGYYFISVASANTYTDDSLKNQFTTPVGTTDADGASTTPAVVAPVSTTASFDDIKYGDTVRIRAVYIGEPRHDGYLSPCGYINDDATVGVVAVALRPDDSYTNSGGDASGLRDWRVDGGTVGQAVQYGDSIQLMSMVVNPTNFGMVSNNYLSPGWAGPDAACGTATTLRPDHWFTQFEPNSNLRKWKILGGTGTVKRGDKVQLKAFASQFEGHEGYLSPCGFSWGACGIGATLRPQASFDAMGSPSDLRLWRIEYVR